MKRFYVKNPKLNNIEHFYGRVDFEIIFSRPKG